MSNEREIVVLSRDAYSIVMFPIDPNEPGGSNWEGVVYLRGVSWSLKSQYGRGFGDTVEALDAAMRDHFISTGEMVEGGNDG